MVQNKSILRREKQGSKSGLTRRRVLQITGAAAGAGIAGFPAIFTSISAADGPIRIGSLLPHSKYYADSGRDSLEGAMLAIEEVNAEGGVLGRKVELVQEDTATTPGVAIPKAQKLVRRDRVDFLTGGISSAVAIAISEWAQREKILFIASGSHSNHTTGLKAHRVTFRTTCSNAMLAAACATWVGQNYGTELYHITADYTWGHTGRDAMNKVIVGQMGGHEVGNDFTPLKTVDFTPFLLKAAAHKPDVLILNLYGSNQIDAVKQFKELGLNKKMRLAGPLSGLPMMRGIGEAAEGVWGCPWLASVDTPGSQDLRRKLHARFKKYDEWEVSYRHYLGYITHRELCAAIARAGTTDTVAVIKALEGHEFDGLKHHPSRWREWDHQNVQDVYVGRAKRGADWKTEGDYFEIVGVVEGEKAARSRKENPVQLEPYESLT